MKRVFSGRVLEARDLELSDVLVSSRPGIVCLLDWFPSEHGDAEAGSHDFQGVRFGLFHVDVLLYSA